MLLPSAFMAKMSELAFVLSWLPNAIRFPSGDHAAPCSSIPAVRVRFRARPLLGLTTKMSGHWRLSARLLEKTISPDAAAEGSDARDVDASATPAAAITRALMTQCIAVRLASGC